MSDESSIEMASMPPMSETPPAVQPPPTVDVPAAEDAGGLPPTSLTRHPDAPAFPCAPPSLEEVLKERKTIYTPEERAEAWKETAEVVQRYSDEMIKRWNAEIDTYLVFAGLFSAMLTAFNVQSYVLLQPTGPDPTLAALQQISLQLSSFSSTGSSPTLVNSTHPAFEQTDTPPPPVPRSAVWLNTLWFTSLILSLSSASIAMLAKQWLNAYASDLSAENSRQTARLRQFRLNGLVTWHVADIIDVIPVLLQLAVALFLAGLLVLLWTLDATVATVASVFTGLLGAFALATMMLPSIRFGCAYLSPQSLALNYVFHHAIYHFKTSLFHLLKALHEWVGCLRHRYGSTTTLTHIQQSLLNGMCMFYPSDFRTWRGRERTDVSTQRISSLLDDNTLTQAYDTSLNSRCLAVCLSEFAPRDASQCLYQLYRVDEKHFGFNNTDVCYDLVVARATEPVALENLWADSLLCLYVYRPRRDDAIEQMKLTNGRAKGLGRIFERLSLHFSLSGSLATHAPVVGAGGSVERILVALSIILGTNNFAQPDEDLDSTFVYPVLQAMKGLFEWCNYHDVRIGDITLRQVAAALYQHLTAPASCGARPITLEDHIDSVTCLLGCVRRMTTLPNDVNARDLTEILTCVDHALGGLVAVLRDVNHETFVDTVAYLPAVIRAISGFVNLVTEEPHAAPLHARLFSRDCLSVLEHILPILDFELLQDEYPEYWALSGIHNRAGDLECLEDKLVRLRAIGGDPLAAPTRQAGPSPGTSVLWHESSPQPSSFVSTESSESSASISS